MKLLEDARDWFDLEGALGVEVSMVSDLGVFGEDCEAMVVISVEELVDEEKSAERLWNEGGGAFQFKSTPLTLNTQELNICTECNIE